METLKVPQDTPSTNDTSSTELADDIQRGAERIAEFILAIHKVDAECIIFANAPYSRLSARPSALREAFSISEVD